jgi:hypothetical protein
MSDRKIDLPWTIENVERVLAAPALHPQKPPESPHTSWARWARSQVAGSKRPGSTDMHSFNGIWSKGKLGPRGKGDCYERAQRPTTYFLITSKEMNISQQVEGLAQHLDSNGE